MRDSALKLQDKTIFLAGPFTGITQGTMRTLTEMGADVAFVCDSAPHAGRYTEGLNEAREAYPKYGRAVHYPLSLKTAAQVQEAIGRVAESLGRMDVLVNALPLAWEPNISGEQINSVCDTLVEKFLPFFQAKQRGRLIYMFEDASLDGLVEGRGKLEFHETLVKKISDTAEQLRGASTTVNGLALGVTEDFLLKNFSKSPSIRQSLDALKKSHKNVRLLESSDIGQTIAFLASSVSASLTGQVLRLTF